MTMFLLALLGGCGPEYEVRVGLVFLGNPEEELRYEFETPARAAAGETFLVEITTWGGGCISSSHVEVEERPEGVLLMPFDRRLIPGRRTGCTLQLAPKEHTAELRFEEPGNYVLELMGRGESRWTPEELLSVEHTVLVE